MDNPQLSPADKAAIEKRINIMEVEDASITANEVVQRCFKTCIKSNRSKALDATETECISRCTEKFIETSNRIAARFQELQDIATSQDQ